MSDKNHPEYQYLDLLQNILDNGVEKKDHNTGISLYSVFGRQNRYDLSKGFPLLTTKKMYWNGILHELFWFLKGMTNIKYLVDNNVHIWDDYPYKIYKAKVEAGEVNDMTQEEFINKIKEDEEFAKIHGEMPHVYGGQWRAWPASDGREIDQLAWALDTVKNFPDRKHAMVTSWIPEFMYGMALPGKAIKYPLCHIMYHLNVADGKLSCQLYQRSADMFLGVPFNIASYALLTQILAHLAGLKVGDFVHTFGDAHIYGNHIDQCKEQIEREPFLFPRIEIDPAATTLENIQPEHIKLVGYESHDKLKAEMTVAGGFDEKDRTDAIKKAD